MLLVHEEGQRRPAVGGRECGTRRARPTAGPTAAPMTGVAWSARYRLRHGRPSQARPRGRRRARLRLALRHPPQGGRQLRSAPAAPTTRPRSSPPSRATVGRQLAARPRADPDAAHGEPRQWRLGWSIERALRRPLRDAPAGAPAQQRRTGRPAVAPPPPPAPRVAGGVPKLGWLKYVLIVWLVFLVAVPLIAWSKIEKVDATPSGDRPDVAARDDVPPGRQRQPRGPDPQAAARVRRRQGRGPPHRHDHAAAHRVRPQHADVDPPGLDRRRAGARHHQDQRRLRLRRPEAAGQDHRAEHRHPGRRLRRDRVLRVHRRGRRRRAACRSAPSRR